uniref:Nuclear pore protein n=2 Tax=Mesocestoides corti TaxID=53468 RepID=A0A5K3F567_MESCO
MDTLEELVEQSDRLLMEIQGDTDLPMITRSLEQMGSFGEKLCSSRGVRSDIKAARLLGPTVDYDLPNNLSAKLEFLTQAGDIEFSKPKVDMDIHTFLRCERENILFTANEQVKRSVFDEIDSVCRRATSSWWDRQAAAILTALASSSGPIDSAILHSCPSTDTSTSRECFPRVASVDFSADPQSTLSKQELFYANQIDGYLSETLTTSNTVFLHQAAINSGTLNKPSLFNLLYTASNAKSVFFDESKHTDFCEVFRLIKRMFSISALNVDDVGSSETPLLDLPLPVTHDRALEVRSGPSLQIAFLSRAIAHLEAEFMACLQVVVSANPRLAQLGGRPGVRSLVRAFLNVKNPAMQSSGDPDFESSGDFEDGLVDGKPVWPMIYYCLRCGALRDAISVASDAANNLGEFVQILSSFAANGKSLPAKLVTGIRKTYRRVVKTSRDPYKRLVYCLLGRCDLSDAHTNVAQSIDDFLWLRLLQVTIKENANDNQDDGESLTIAQLQNLLYDTYGETYFDAWNQPLMYFKILCLSQQFEGALAFLVRIEELRCHAVHLALVLREMKILLLPATTHAQIISRIDSDPSGFRRLNFVRLLLLYTRKFEIDNPALCVNYYYFLHELSSEERGAPTNLFVRCVAELAIQTGEFDLILGVPGPGGVRQPGAIDRFASVSQPPELIASVAEMLETRGQMAKSASVYLLAGTSKTLLSAVRLTNLLLVGVVAGERNEPGAEGKFTRQTLLQLAAEVGHSVRRLDPIATTAAAGTSPGDVGGDVSCALQSAVQTLYYLLDLATFFDLANAGQFQAALDHMDRLGLLPATPASDEIDAKVAGFAALSDLVRRPIPSALVLLMRCLAAKASVAKATGDRALSIGPTAIGGQSAGLVEARARAHALITFIGRIPHRMPGEVYSTLSKLEMQLSSS